MKLSKGMLQTVLLASVMTLASCSGAPVQVGTQSQIADISNVDFSKGRKVSGSASGFQLLLWIPISINNRHDRAYNALLAEAGGDYVTDIAVTESWTWGFVGTIYKTTIEGMAYPTLE